MKNSIYNLLKVRFLVHENANRNWWFILYLVFLMILMIANAHRFEAKIIRMAQLEEQAKILRTEFIRCRTELMRVKMESAVTDSLAKRQLAAPNQPPHKINVQSQIQPSWWERLWQ